MAWEQPEMRVGEFVANVDLSNSQYCAVDLTASTVGTLSQSTNATAVTLTAAGGKVFGIVQNKPKLGEAATIFTLGISKAKLGGTVAIGANLAATVTGTLITAATGNVICARAIDAGVTGDIATVMLYSGGISA